MNRNARFRRFSLLFPVFALSAPGWAAPPTASAPAEPLSDGKVLFRQYYSVEINGRKVGRMFEKSVEKQTPQGPQIHHFSGLKLEVDRGVASIRITTTGTSVETPDGRPVRYEYHEALGPTMVTRQGEFTTGPDGKLQIALTVKQGDQTLPVQTLPWDSAALMPMAFQRKQLALHPKPGDKMECVIFDPSLPGKPYAPVKLEFLQHGPVELVADVRPGWKIRATIALPGLSNISSEGWFNEAFEPLRVTTSLGGITLTQIACSEEVAKGPNEPLEMMLSTLLSTQRPIPNPRQLAEGEYVLQLKTKVSDPPTLPETGVQKVAPLPLMPGELSAWKVTTHRQPRQLQTTGQTLSKEEKGKYLAVSSMANHQDPEVKKLAEKWRGKAKDPAQIAERLVKGVHENITHKSLDVGYATASDVARTLTGDCTEHAVLLVAALRASGIPARGVTGLVYADQFAGASHIFGYHMWAQGFIAGQWVDLDAALPGQTRVDATHIALGLTSLNDDAPIGELAAIIPLIGNLQMEVVKP